MGCRFAILDLLWFRVWDVPTNLASQHYVYYVGGSGFNVVSFVFRKCSQLLSESVLLMFELVSESFHNGKWVCAKSLSPVIVQCWVHEIRLPTLP